MIEEALFSYFHYLGIILIFISLALEMYLFKADVDDRVYITLRKVDGLYGLASVVVLATGFAKALLFKGGADYYFHNHLLWGKLLLFTVVGVLSIIPTVKFLKWGKMVKNGTSPEVDLGTVRRLRLIIRLELILVILIPLLAVFMARGYGYVAPS